MLSIELTIATEVKLGHQFGLLFCKAIPIASICESPTPFLPVYWVNCQKILFSKIVTHFFTKIWQPILISHPFFTRPILIIVASFDISMNESNGYN